MMTLRIWIVCLGPRGVDCKQYRDLNGYQQYCLAFLFNKFLIPHPPNRYVNCFSRLLHCIFLAGSIKQSVPRRRLSLLISVILEGSPSNLQDLWTRNLESRKPQPGGAPKPGSRRARLLDPTLNDTKLPYLAHGRAKSSSTDLGPNW